MNPVKELVDAESENVDGKAGFSDVEEHLVKSADRVRDLGEVFTPRQTVEDMLNLLPTDVWNPHPSKTFLEPGCGDGNFLVAVLDRKLGAVADAWRNDLLPAGTDRRALRFHALEALSSIYGVDISEENIIGGVPDHPVGARERMLGHFYVWYEQTTGVRIRETERIVKCAEWIVTSNVILGNLREAERNPSEVPLVSYEWAPVRCRVGLTHTTFSNVIQQARGESSGAHPLFSLEEPCVGWRGPFDRLSEASRQGGGIE